MATNRTRVKVGSGVIEEGLPDKLPTVAAPPLQPRLISFVDEEVSTLKPAEPDEQAASVAEEGAQAPVETLDPDEQPVGSDAPPADVVDLLESLPAEAPVEPPTNEEDMAHIHTPEGAALLDQINAENAADPRYKGVPPAPPAEPEPAQAAEAAPPAEEVETVRQPKIGFEIETFLNELRETFERVAPGAAGEQSVASLIVLSHVRLVLDEQQAIKHGNTPLRFAATNLDMAREDELPVRVVRWGEGVTVPVKLFTNLLKNTQKLFDIEYEDMKEKGGKKGDKPRVMVRLSVDGETREMRFTAIGLKDGDIEATINCGDPADFPAMPERGAQRVVVLDNAPTLAMLARVNTAVATANDRPILTGLAWRWGDKTLSMIGADGHRLITDELSLDLAAMHNSYKRPSTLSRPALTAPEVAEEAAPAEAAEAPAAKNGKAKKKKAAPAPAPAGATLPLSDEWVMPRDAVLAALEFLAETKQAIEVSVRWVGTNDASAASLVFMQSGGRVLSFQTMDGRYPDVERVIPNPQARDRGDFSAPIKLLMFHLKLALESTASGSKIVRITPKPKEGKIEIQMRAEGIGGAKGHVNASIDGVEITNSVNVDLMIEMLDTLVDEGGEININYHSEDSSRPVMLQRAKNGSKLRMVLMPMTIR